jgi:aminopeptidase Y
VTAQVQAVDLVLPPTPAPSSTSGCEASDFAGFVAGRIALNWPRTRARRFG